MSNLNTIQVQRVDDGRFAEATIVRLTIDMAQKMIDETWWNLPESILRDIKDEGDSRWKWAKIVDEYNGSSLRECVAVLSKEGYIEGCVAYKFNVKSQLEPNEGCAYIGWLATATHNRNWLVNKPIYKGIGSGLVYWVVKESYKAGLGGRVFLQSLPTQNTLDFYKKKGFVRTNLSQPKTGLISYELPKSAAEAWLRKEGALS